MTTLDHHMQIAKKVMIDENTYTLQISLADTWIIVSIMQLALRHPNIGGALKIRTHELCDLFINQITTYHPEAANLLEMGFDHQHDIE